MSSGFEYSQDGDDDNHFYDWEDLDGRWITVEGADDTQENRSGNGVTVGAECAKLLKCDVFEDSQVGSPILSNANGTSTTTSGRPSTPQRCTRLLRRLDTCAHDVLQRYIEEHDLPLLRQAVDIFELGIGTPDAVRNRMKESKTSEKPRSATVLAEESNGLTEEQQKELNELLRRYPKQASTGLISCPSYSPLLRGCEGLDDVTRMRSTAGSLGWAVSWDVVAEQLWYACILLERVVGIFPSHSRANEEAGSTRISVLYKVPNPYLARIVPILYAWAVDWEFICRFLIVWRRVTTTLIRLIPSSSWRLHSPPVHLPWQPLLGLVKMLTSLNSFNSPTLVSPRFQLHTKKINDIVMGLCAKCSSYFKSDEALQSMWDLFSPSISRETTNKACLNLLFFKYLCPMRAVMIPPSPPLEDVRQASSAPSTTTLSSLSTGNSMMTTNKPMSLAPPIDTLFQFIFGEHSSDYSTTLWGLTSLDFVSSVVKIHPGMIDFVDKYAEPFFTSALRALELDEAWRWMHSARDVDRFTSQPRKSFSYNSVPFLIAQPIATVLNYSLPPRTSSPLWNHFRRFIQATKVFLLASGNPSLSSRVVNLYVAIVTSARGRIAHLKKTLQDDSPDFFIDDTAWERRKQELQMVAQTNSKFFFSYKSSPLLSRDDGEDRPSSGREDAGGEGSASNNHTSSSMNGARPTPSVMELLPPEGTCWTNEMTESFVDGIKDVSLLSLDLRLSHDTVSLAALLTQLAPGKMVVEICKKVSLALEHPSQDLAPQREALKLLKGCAYPILLSTSRCRQAKTEIASLSMASKKSLESLFCVAPSENGESGFYGASSLPSDIFLAYIQEEILPRTAGWWKAADTSLSVALIYLFWVISTLPSAFQQLFGTHNHHGGGSPTSSAEELAFVSSLTEYLCTVTGQQDILSSHSFCTALRSILDALSADAFQQMAHTLLDAIKMKKDGNSPLDALLTVLSFRSPSLPLEFARTHLLPVLRKALPDGAGGASPALSSLAGSPSHRPLDEMSKERACKLLSLCVSNGARDEVLELFPTIRKIIEYELVENISSASGQKTGLKLYRSVFSALLLPHCVARMRDTEKEGKGEEEGDHRGHTTASSSRWWIQRGVCAVDEVHLTWDVPRRPHVLAIKEFADHLLDDLMFLAANLVDVEPNEKEDDPKTGEKASKKSHTGDREEEEEEEKQKTEKATAAGKERTSSEKKCCLADLVVKGSWNRRQVAKKEERRKKEEEKKKKGRGQGSATTATTASSSSPAEKKDDTSEAADASSSRQEISLSGVIEGVTSMLTAVLRLHSVFFHFSSPDASAVEDSFPLHSLKHWADQPRCSSLIPYLALAVGSSPSSASTLLAPKYSVNAIHDVLYQWVLPLVDRSSKTAHDARHGVGGEGVAAAEREETTMASLEATRAKSVLLSHLPTYPLPPAPLQSIVHQLEEDEEEKVQPQSLVSTIHALLSLANISPARSRPKDGEGKGNDEGEGGEGSRGGCSSSQRKEAWYSLASERRSFFSCYTVNSQAPKGRIGETIAGGFQATFFPPAFWSLQAEVVFRSFHGAYSFPPLSLHRKQHVLEVVYRQFFVGASVSPQVMSACKSPLLVMLRQWLLPPPRQTFFRSMAEVLQTLSFHVLHEKSSDAAALYHRLLLGTDEEGGGGGGGGGLTDASSPLTSLLHSSMDVEEEEEEEEEEANHGPHTTTTPPLLSPLHEDEMNGPSPLHTTVAKKKGEKGGDRHPSGRTTAFLEKYGIAKRVVAELMNQVYKWLDGSFTFSCTTAQLQLLQVVITFPYDAFSFRPSASIDRMLPSVLFPGVQDTERTWGNAQQLVRLATRYAPFQPKQSSLCLWIAVNWLQPRYEETTMTATSGGGGGGVTMMRKEERRENAPPALSLTAVLPELFSLSTHSAAMVQRGARQLLSVLWMSCSTLRWCSTAIRMGGVQEGHPRDTAAAVPLADPLHPTEGGVPCRLHAPFTPSVEEVAMFREVYENRIQKYFPFSVLETGQVRFLPRLVVITSCGKEETEQLRLKVRGREEDLEEAEEEAFHLFCAADKADDRIFGTYSKYPSRDPFTSSVDEAVSRFLSPFFFPSSSSSSTTIALSSSIPSEAIKKSRVWSFIENTKLNVKLMDESARGKGGGGSAVWAALEGQRFFDAHQVLLWNAICRVLTPDRLLPLLLEAIPLALHEYFADHHPHSHSRVGANATKMEEEEPSSAMADTKLEKIERYSTILMMGLGCVEATKSLVWQRRSSRESGEEGRKNRAPPASASGVPLTRALILEKTILPLMKTALAPEAPDEITSLFLTGLTSLSDALTPQEVWQLYEGILKDLEDTERQLKEGGNPQSRWVATRFFALVRLFACFKEEITAPLLDPLLAYLHRIPYTLWCGPTSLWRGAAAHFLTKLVDLPSVESDVVRGNQHLTEKVIDFLQRDFFDPLEFPKSGATQEPWPHTNANRLSKIKTFALFLRMPTSAILAPLHVPITSCLLRAMAISLPEKDDLDAILHASLMYLAAAPVSKSLSHQLIDLWTSILIQGVLPPLLGNGKETSRSSGASASDASVLHRRARAELLHGLSLLLFHNLHRIGKFTFMQQVGDAAIRSIAVTDDTITRKEAQHVFTILCQVASVEQISSLLHGYEEELKKLAMGQTSWKTALPLTPTRKSENGMEDDDEEASHIKKNRLGILSVLCAAVLADSGGDPPAYVPRIMRRLVSYADDPFVEVKRVVRSTFEAWWKSHRLRWETVVKYRFTPIQIEAMKPLLTAPEYFV